MGRRLFSRISVLLVTYLAELNRAPLGLNCAKTDISASTIIFETASTIIGGFSGRYGTDSTEIRTVEPYASEDEQIEQIKRWWKENGRSLVFGLVVGIGGLAGYRYWDAAETARAESASVNYDLLLQLITDQRLEDAEQAGQTIIDSDPQSSYARLSTLLLAKLAVERDDYDRAKALLQGLVKGSTDSEILLIARARLARLMLAEKDVDGAAKQLDAVADLPDRKRFTELRADVLSAQGNQDEARKLYLDALEQAEELGLERGAIQLKLDNLAGS